MTVTLSRRAALSGAASMMPRTRDEWARTYSVEVADDRLAPRVCRGELLIFDPLAPVVVGSVVAVAFDRGNGASERLLGVLVERSANGLSVALGLTAKPVPFDAGTSPYTVHAAVGVMMRLDHPDDHSNAAINAALRRQLNDA